MTPGSGFEGFIAAQVAGFRERSGLLAVYGAREAAESLERAAKDLEGAFRRWWLEGLPVSQAAPETGYSEERLRELVREGRVNGLRDGVRGAIRLRRCDLPHKAGHSAAPSLDRLAAKLGIE